MLVALYWKKYSEVYPNNGVESKMDYKQAKRWQIHVFSDEF